MICLLTLRVTRDVNRDYDSTVDQANNTKEDGCISKKDNVESSISPRNDLQVLVIDVSDDSYPLKNSLRHHEKRVILVYILHIQMLFQYLKFSTY